MKRILAFAIPLSLVLVLAFLFFWEQNVCLSNDDFFHNVNHMVEEQRINTTTKVIEITLSNFRYCNDLGCGLAQAFDNLSVPGRVSISDGGKDDGSEGFKSLLFTKDIVLQRSAQSFVLTSDELKSIKSKLTDGEMYSIGITIPLPPNNLSVIQRDDTGEPPFRHPTGTFEGKWGWYKTEEILELLN